MFWRFQNRIDWENIGDAETFLFFSNTFSMKLVVIQLSENNMNRNRYLQNTKNNKKTYSDSKTGTNSKIYWMQFFLPCRNLRER